MFPRFLWFGQGVEPWFPAPEDERLAEVRLGLLPPNYRQQRVAHMMPAFCQEAPLGFALRDLKGDEHVVVQGMHPEHASVEFKLPGLPPSVEFLIEGRRELAHVRTHSVIIEPEAMQVSLVCGATVPLHRTFLPGVHKLIPVAVSIGGDRPIDYQAPPTIRDRLAHAASQRTS
jgi:hypothetical protein